MNVVDAHGMIASRQDEGKSLLPEDITIEAVSGLEPIVPLVTAAAALSGMLDEAVTDTDLDEAVQHFNSLLAAGVFSTEEWTSEADEVIHAILAWGDAQEREQCLSE